MEKNFISLAIESLDPAQIEQLAVESGLQTRKPRKITPLALLNLYCQESINKSPSFNDIAGVINDSTGDTPSRQAVGRRINAKFVSFLKMVLETALSEKALENFPDTIAEVGYFGRIVVQDSTIVKLPAKLFDEFSGVSNGYTTVCNARIQGIYDLISRSFIDFSIDKYSKNDSLAASALEILANDLVLRDRGYLRNDEIIRIGGADAYCIYRHITGTIYRDRETDAVVELEKILSKNEYMDIDVCLNDESRTPIRIVAAPVGEEVANIRRMKAKNEMKGHNPSARVLFLMDWTIFIVNLPRDKFSFKTILALYGLRWRIENIFKTWKSNMAFGLIHNVSSIQLRATLMARLITIVVIMRGIYRQCDRFIAGSSKRRLSLAKLMRYIQVRKERLIEILADLTKNSKRTILSLIRYCTYDMRKKRFNYVQQEELILDEIFLS